MRVQEIDHLAQLRSEYVIRSLIDEVRRGRVA